MRARANVLRRRRAACTAREVIASASCAVLLGGAVVPNGGDVIERAFGGAAIALGNFAGCSAHAFAHRVVFDQLNPDFAETWACRHLNARVHVEKLVGHLFEIFHEGAENWRTREPGRFENIVSAGGNERAAHEGGVRKGIEAGQFADGIKEEDVGGFIERGGKVEFAAPDNFPTACCGNGSRGVELRGLARGEDQQRAAELALHKIVCGEDGFFFAGDYAAGDEDWPAFLLADLLLEPLTETGDGGRGGVIFQISCDRYTVWCSAHGL